MKTCYIIGAGDFHGDFDPDKDDLVIAADGGYDTLVDLEKECQLFVGDMDSLKEYPAGLEILRYPVEKDETDMFLAYREGRRRGYSKFRLYGGVGGRIDHTFANFSLLIYAKNANDNLTLIADGYEIFAIKNEKIELTGKTGKTFSVFAFGNEARGVSIRGAKYDVENATITPDFPLGVSNSFKCEKCEIEVKDGVLLVMREI